MRKQSIANENKNTRIWKEIGKYLKDMSGGDFRNENATTLLFGATGRGEGKGRRREGDRDWISFSLKC